MHQCIKFISFWNDTLHVSDGLSVHHQEFKTVHTATGICQTLASRQQYLFDICLCISWIIKRLVELEHIETVI